MTDSLDDFHRQGFLVMKDMLDAAAVAEVRAALEPDLAALPHGRNEFEGFRTRRLYSLPARSRAYDQLLVHPRVLAVCDAMLSPAYLLSTALAIQIEPGESRQLLHFDDAFYQIPRPHPPIGITILFAVDDFSAENGGTVVVPGSHLWPDDIAESALERTEQISMPSGSALIYYGTLWHGGGANRTDRNRLAVAINYIAPWARQQENYALAIPLERVREMPERIQALIGFEIHYPFMGHVNGLHPRRVLK